jgi:hypothetical protein
MVRTVYQNNTTKVDQLLLPASVAMKCVESMLVERRARAKIIPTTRPAFSDQAQVLDATPSAPPMNSSTLAPTKSTPKTENPDDDPQELKTQENTDECRDPGVSDAVWQSLQNDKELAELRAKQLEQDIRNQEKAQRLAEEAEKEAEEEAKRIAAILLETQAKNEAKALELLRQREEARIREIEAKAERKRVQREVERMRQEEWERKALEERAQVKLRKMGVCPVGYRWIKQSGGYRCAGGSHWVDDSRLGV